MEGMVSPSAPRPLRAVIAALALVLCLSAAASRAQESGDAPAASAGSSEEDRAFELYQSARGFYERGEFQEALDRLEEAWSLFSHPAIGVKLAEVYEKLDRLEEALAALEAVETDDPQFGERVDVRKRALQNQLNKPLKVSVVSNTEQTEVVVNHEQRRVAPFEIMLPRGLHVMEASSPGYRPVQRTVEVQGGGPMVVRFDLQPLTGTVAVRALDDSLEGLHVLVDGVKWSISDNERMLRQSRPRTIRVGRHQLACWKEGWSKDVRSFEVREAEDVVLTCRSAPPAAGGALRPLGITAAALGGAAVATGIGLLVEFKIDKDDAASDPRFSRVTDDGKIWGSVAVAGGVTLGVTSFFLLRKARAERSAEGSVHTSEDQQRPTVLLGSGPGLGAGALLRY